MDRLQIIDTAVREEFLDKYAPLVKRPDAKDSKIWWVNTRRDFASLFAQAVDQTEGDDTAQNKEKSERLKLPRISIMRLDIAPDPDRQRPANLRQRNVGRSDDGKRVYSAPFPIPINIDYQIDFWTRRISEMNRWEIQYHDDFRQQVHYITMQVDDDLFQRKLIGLLSSAGLEDNSDLEPGEDRPLYRKTMRMTAPTWIFPTAEQVTSDPAVRAILVDLYSRDPATSEEEFLERLIVTGG